MKFLSYFYYNFNDLPHLPDNQAKVNINEPPRSKLRGISWLVATLQAKQASGNITRRFNI
jgi:hypothetical protein